MILKEQKLDANYVKKQQGILKPEDATNVIKENGINAIKNCIINEDCLETMKRMSDNFIDLVVTSPPYDNLRDYNGFTFDFESIAKELYRITKEGGVIVWVVGDATINGSETGTSFKQALYFKEVGFNLHDTMIWERRTTPQNNKRYEPGFEYMFVLSKNTLKTFNPILSKRLYNDKRKSKTFHRDADDEYSFNKVNFTQQDEVVISNVWQISNRGNDNLAHNHPAIFPEKLVSDHIKSWSNEGDLVYDPFMGSGTTAKIAKLLNRNYIGSEISSEYCEIIKKRLAQQVLI